jgi:hypothetical protein
MDDLIADFYNKNKPWIQIGFIIILLISLFFYVGMFYELGKELIAWVPILVFGDSAQGTVTSQTTVESEGTFYQLEFNYQVTSESGGSRSFSSKLLVSQYFWRNHDPGSPISVSYLPWYPKMARISGHPYELNMWMMTFCLYSVVILQIILLPLGVLFGTKNRKAKGRIMSLRAGGITILIVTILVLILEFIVDWLGMNLGVFSGGAIPLIVGIGSGVIGANFIWRTQGRSLPPSND